MMRITPLTLDSATVYPDRIELVVDIAHSRFAFSSKPLIAALLHTHPYLLEHACKNERGKTFAAVAETTSTPHVLEHLIIDNQIRACAQVPSPQNNEGILVGTTQWDEGSDPYVDPYVDKSDVSGALQGEQMTLKAIVRVSFFDDVTAFAAINAALAELNELLVTTC